MATILLPILVNAATPMSRSHAIGKLLTEHLAAAIDMLEATGELARDECTIGDTHAVSLGGAERPNDKRPHPFFEESGEAMRVYGLLILAAFVGAASARAARFAANLLVTSRLLKIAAKEIGCNAKGGQA
jgi:hypothetical protein